jgi:hypothetical protein
MNQEYELNEKDIDSALSFLRIHEPDKATPERAIALLEFMYVSAHVMVQHRASPDLEEVYQKFLEHEKRSKD